MNTNNEKQKFSRRLNQLLDDLDFKKKGRPKALGAECGVSGKAAEKWLSGDSLPNQERRIILMDKFGEKAGWTYEELFYTGKAGEINEKHTRYSGQKNLQPVDFRGNKVPIISEVTAGDWCDAIDNYAVGDAEDWIECPINHGKHTYALRVKGDSMTCPYPGKPTYPEGTIIYVDPGKQYISGCRVIARLPGSNEAIFKEYREENGKKWLKPLNPQYPIIEINEETLICGVIIGQFIPE